MLIKEMRTEDKPRERFADSPANVSVTDLIAILLRTGRKGHSVMEIARDVVQRLEIAAGGSGFDDLDWRDLTDIKGIGRDKSITICAAVELGRRLCCLYSKQQLSHFGSPTEVSSYFMEKLRHENQEHFLVCFLNAKNKLLGYKEISIGNMNAASVDIKESMRWALRYKAFNIILIHNHPSGDPEPSDADITLTKAFSKASKLLDMSVLDHIVIGDGVFVSLCERGYL